VLPARQCRDGAGKPGVFPASLRFAFPRQLQYREARMLRDVKGE
jgi:hypothetical protein